MSEHQQLDYAHQEVPFENARMLNLIATSSCVVKTSTSKRLRSFSRILSNRYTLTTTFRRQGGYHHQIAYCDPIVTRNLSNIAHNQQMRARLAYTSC
ncbi:hypothetical protein NECAME_08999 [Necator americanus]|uniref:Uncharacterized protein n=1 Tax=Necator americanus TaxID=51031 RepID=W2TI57_NECAM|nr:hypothetical protein NECAME_08999 [Necator americanus]ETN80717.1 hypothetical protein NECAME_08999 [Necator americanus]